MPLQREVSADDEVLRIAKKLSGFQYHFASESDLQDATSEILRTDSISVLREYELRPFGRIDFYAPEIRLGIEIKTQGSPSAVLQQMMGYARHDEIRFLILLTARIKLAQVPEELNGKKLYPVALWANGL